MSLIENEKIYIYITWVRFGFWSMWHEKKKQKIKEMRTCSLKPFIINPCTKTPIGSTWAQCRGPGVSGWESGRADSRGGRPPSTFCGTKPQQLSAHWIVCHAGGFIILLPLPDLLLVLFLLPKNFLWAVESFWVGWLLAQKFIFLSLAKKREWVSSATKLNILRLVITTEAQSDHNWDYYYYIWSEFAATVLSPIAA